MKAPPGSLVKLYYDGWHPMAEGEALRTPSGRGYLVVENRIQKRGKHAGRQHLRAVVYAADEPFPPGTAVFPLVWYRRARRLPAALAA